MFYSLFSVNTESKIYHTMMAAKALICNIARSGMQTIRKIKLVLLSFHERFLNFKENIGISETNNQENTQTNANRYRGWQLSDTNQL